MLDKRFRCLPGVDRVLSEEKVRCLQQNYPHGLLVEVVRQCLEQCRRSIAQGNPCPPMEQIVESVCARVQSLAHCSLRPVINATGVILHTNLGRAPLSGEATAAMDAVAGGYCNLEFDLDSGRRSNRNVHVEQVLCQLTGAEAALVVNNNASAVLLAVTALARRKEIIVSRSQSVEIGGSFRIPDVIRQGGAKLVEVGTTNCTYVSDYEGAINPRTTAVMRVHSSNFRIMGFTSSVALEELVAIGKQYNVLVLDDLGSGCFLDTSAFGLDPEPMVQQSVASGADLVFFSGDKLMGGPQAGIIVGRKQFIGKLRKYPLARAVRIDKARLAALAVTLLHYLKDEALTMIPVWRMVSAPLEEIDQRARMWAEALDGLAQLMDGETMVGGGSLPGGTLTTRLVAIGSGGRRKASGMAQMVALRLREEDPPVVGRINGDLLLLDPRSTLPENDGVVLRALENVAASVRFLQ